MARMLLDSGAPVDVSARGEGGTPLVVALFWGNRETAELLARYGVAPANLRAAAGLGRLDLIDELIAPDGRLAAQAGAQRGFYRPHSGFPAWRPAAERQEVLDESLSWAARNDRVEALDVLVAAVRRWRPMSIAAPRSRGRRPAGAPTSIRRLVALGANPSQRTTFGGPSHGEGATALHLAAQNGDLDAIRALLDAGADPGLEDALHGGTPAHWAEHAGQHAAAELLAPGAG